MAKLGGQITVFVPRVYCPKLLRRFEKWKNQGHDVPLCDIPGLNTIPVPMLRLPGNWYNRWTGFMAYMSMRRRAEELHAIEKFDVIYATDLFPDGNAAARLGKRLGIPSTCLAIGVDVNYTAHSTPALYRHFVETVRGLDGTLACGRSVAEGIEKVRGDKTLEVYGVVDLDAFAPATNLGSLLEQLGIDREELVILFAGYLSNRKGVHELMEAYAKVAQQVGRSTRLVLCGAGEEEARLRETAQQRGVNGSVFFQGEVAPEAMSNWMKASDVFVLPSHTEGMPNAVMEAMACGTPIVSTKVGGLPAAIGDCDGAILVEPKNVEQLAEAMSRVLKDSALRQSMSNAARARAEERFGVTVNARRILTYLGEVVSNAKKKTASERIN